MDRYFYIAVGAAAGGMLRHGLGSVTAQRFGPQFPMGTLVVNLTGCFLIGLAMSLLDRFGANPRWGFLLVTGLLGGYTTFSSFGWETYVFVRHGLPLRALAYPLISVVGGVLAVWLGAFMAGLNRPA